ncbi:hypothetical protein LN429_15380 [Pseudomonas syringae]|uniref:hypothetical protein n=1 Tax=Pseudomonas syringae TaxID=317 RepID=UPI00234DB52E|nr:hypothetical protein [Pseudomonas syringae]MDC6536485.1 hypothetical protein [Pseudomonas syringae]
MFKRVEGLLAFALMGIAIGGVIGGRDGAAASFQPEWFSPSVSGFYAICNFLALWALVRSADGWLMIVKYVFTLIGAWFAPPMIMLLSNSSEQWLPHLLWGFMLSVPVAIIAEVMLRERRTRLSRVAERSP